MKAKLHSPLHASSPSSLEQFSSTELGGEESDYYPSPAITTGVINRFPSPQPASSATSPTRRGLQIELQTCAPHLIHSSPSTVSSVDSSLAIEEIRRDGSALAALQSPHPYEPNLNFHHRFSSTDALIAAPESYSVSHSLLTPVSIAGASNSVAANHHHHHHHQSIEDELQAAAAAQHHQPVTWFQRCVAYLCSYICTPSCNMCTVICCFGCLTCMGCRDKVCQRLVFFPPMPFYAIETKDNKQTLWLVEEGKKIEPYTSPNMRMAFIGTRKKSTVCTMWIRWPGATTTVIFSHGNATDIGCMRDHIIDFARQLQVNVLIYDYTGYGLSAGQPAMAHTLADAEAAYDYLMKTYPQESQRVIVYGQSLGSGPTVHLSRNRRVNGVVIHAGIMSALRVIQPATPSTRWFDIYPNVDLIRQTRSTVFIIHGTADQEIPFEHGKGLHEAAAVKFKPWFVEGAGHNNIEVDFRDALFAKLDAFIRYIENTTPVVSQLEDPLSKDPVDAQIQKNAAQAAANRNSNGVASSSSASPDVQMLPASSSSSVAAAGTGSSSTQPHQKKNGKASNQRESFDRI